jgi:hypothetical protein
MKIKILRPSKIMGHSGGGKVNKTVIEDTRIIPEGVPDTRVTPEGDTRVAPRLV